MTVSELEATYRQLHEQMLRGELAEQDFKAEVEQLRFTDDLGTQWKIGWYTGKWYRYDDGQWVQDKPLAQQEPTAPVKAAPVTGVGTPPPAEDSKERRPLTPCLVVALIALLLVASVVLIFGWNTDRWRPSEEDSTAIADATAAAEATAVAKTAPTETSAPLPSDTAQATKTARATATRAPSNTSAPTATRQRATATSQASTPTTKPTRTPRTTTSPTSTASRTPTTEATAEPTPTARTATKPTPTTASGLSGRIYFPVYDNNPDRRTFDIHVFRLDSGERDILIRQASEPALSPNGKRIAYRSWDSGRRGILVRELTDGNTWPWINFHEAAHPSWSPNSQNITFASQQELDRRWRLYRTWGLDSDRIRREGGDIFGRVPVWSADGRIVYWECPIDKCGLYAIADDGTNLTRLTGREHDIAPATSPDGSQLAFMSNIDGNWEIYATTTHPAGGQVQEPTRLTKNSARDGLPTWSPDGRWLAFASDRAGSWAVYVMRPNGSGQQLLFDLGGSLEGQVADVPPSEQPGWTWETLGWGR